MPAPVDSGTARKRRPRSRGPWSRLLTGLAIAGPAVWVGGVHPHVVPAFAAVVLGLWLRVCARSQEPLRVPPVAILGGLLVGATLLQWLPIPGLREVAAPGLDAMMDAALSGTGVAPRPGLTPVPGDTLLEVSRLAALTFLVIAAAQLSWRVTAMLVAVTGTLVATVGLAHEVLGLDAIYGVYEAQHVDRSTVPALLGTFVNPNHQSGLFLLGLFCSAALAVDQQILGLTTRDASKAEVYRDRFLAALGAVMIQLPALVLSLSRGALLAFLIVAPAAAALALRRSRAERKADPRHTHPTAVRLLIGGGLVVLVAIVAQHGAWQELSSLWSTDELAKDDKVAMLVQAPALIDLSPILGTGRGSFIDLFPSAEAVPSHVLSTHLESAPLTMVVEWGPLVGGLALLGISAWFVAAMWYGGHKSDARPRRIALLGLLALAIHNAADFALDFLGVAAPACAMAGALSPARFLDWRVPRARAVGVVVLGAAIGIGAWAVPRTWSQRPALDAAARISSVPDRSLLTARPLDSGLHVAIARRLLEEGDAAGAHARASAASILRPGSMDAWLVRSSAAATLGNTVDADASMARALALIYVAPGEALIQYLLERYPQPSALAAVAPSQPLPWRLLVRALIDPAPAHADAVAEVRALAAPADPEPLHLRSRIAIVRGNPALALHHARLLRQVAPEQANAYLSIAAALAALGERQDEIVDILEAGLADEAVVDPAEIGRIEEHLVRVLLRRSDAASLSRAKAVVPDLLSRPAARDVRRRRRELAKAVAERDR